MMQSTRRANAAVCRRAVRALLVIGAAVYIAACASGANDPAVTVAIANGRAIFQTGKDANGVAITAAPAALRVSCAACHHANGAGGIRLPGGAVSADLRRSALRSGRHPYTLALLERAISTGIDNDGERLNAAMPRWKLSKRDLHDVATYVLTQLK